VGEVVAFVQQGFIRGFCERVSEAVSEVQLCRMRGALAEVSVGLPGDQGLVLGEWLDADLAEG